MPDRRFGGVFHSGAGLAAAGFIEETRTRSPVKSHDARATACLEKLPDDRAFDEYRVETLKRLEEEQTEFKDFLDRLRHAKDKEEFDAFMAQHRPRPTPPSDGQPQA
jgi:hypothetical protein